jgi:hypothetical protein
MPKAIVMRQTGSPEVLKWVDYDPDRRVPVKFVFARMPSG